jgi:hypothetical protein
MFGKKSDGASFATHAAMQKEGVGPYDTPPPPPPPPPSNTSQVGSTQRGNPEGLKAALMKRGMTEKEADEKIARSNKGTGLK